MDVPEGHSVPIISHQDSNRLEMSICGRVLQSPPRREKHSGERASLAPSAYQGQRALGHGRELQSKFWFFQCDGVGTTEPAYPIIC